jgi:tRNA splicing endonuclease
LKLEPSWFERFFKGKAADGLKEKRNIASNDLLSIQEYANYKEPMILSPQEAFFLSWGLGCLDLYQNSVLLNSQNLLELFNRDNVDFLMRYAAYHYYRSLGWVVRSGILYPTRTCIRR